MYDISAGEFNVYNRGLSKNINIILIFCQLDQKCFYDMRHFGRSVKDSNFRKPYGIGSFQDYCTRPDYANAPNNLKSYILLRLFSRFLNS